MNSHIKKLHDLKDQNLTNNSSNELIMNYDINMI